MDACARIGGRLVAITTCEIEGAECVAVGVVKRGLRLEVGMTFVSTGPDPEAAATRVALDIEAYFD